MVGWFKDCEWLHGLNFHGALGTMNRNSFEVGAVLVLPCAQIRQVQRHLWFYDLPRNCADGGDSIYVLVP